MSPSTGPGVEGISVSGEGVHFSVERAVAANTRSDGVTADPIAAAIAATDGLSITEAMTINGLALTGVRGRGADGDGAVVIDLGREVEGERRVVLVEEDGHYTWGIPARGEGRLRLPVEAVPGSRGLLGKQIRRVLRVVAVKTIGWAVHGATGTIVGAWDERRHPHRLRAWTPDNHRDPNGPPPDLQAMGAGRALLVIHGFTGSIHGSFGDLDPDVVHTWHRAYEGRTFAYDHPTLTVSPRENAQWLVRHAADQGVALDVDILAHSRGGLVARELAQQLTDHGITVRSINFVATPNNGTPLGDPTRPEGLLDCLTNLVGAIPGSDVLQLVLELLKDVVIGTSLRALTGLVAMQPDGTYLRDLNQHRINPTTTALRAITADFEPQSDAGIVRTARDRLIDAYFGGVRNDLIVPTLSTVVTGGEFGIRAGARLVLDSSRGVDHSSFWTNPRAVGQLTDWLRADWQQNPPADIPDEETDPGAELAEPLEPHKIGNVIQIVNGLKDETRKAVEVLVGGPITRSATPAGTNRPAVVVVPGIMGTHLRRRTGELIWIDVLRLMRGHFGDLSLTPPLTEVEPAGLNRTYLPLITRLAASCDVHLAPYDWRLDIRTAARQLATVVGPLLHENRDRPVHLVAHSMGGLVARALIAEAPEVWAELASERRGDSGRLVMLGTPNRGSFSIVLTLSGDELILKALASVDWRADLRRLTEVVATFPGVYQMLPSSTAEPGDDNHRALFEAATWGRQSPVRQDLLTDAQAFHRTLEAAHERMGEEGCRRLVSVVGYGQPTPYRLAIEEPGTLRVGSILRGDGRVAIPLCQLKGVTHYYCRAAHGDLPSEPLVLDSLDALLAGDAGKLQHKEPEFRSAEAVERPVMIPVGLFDPAPAADVRDGSGAISRRRSEARLQEGLRPALGGGGVSGPRRAQVKVRVVQGSLEQADFPVAVGHYTGVPVGGSEAFLDEKLGGVLRRRQALGHTPEASGSAVYVPAPPGHRPRGAVVLGLGEFGTLTGARLSEAMAQAVIALVLDDRERSGQTSGPIDVGISSVLVGTPGRHGLTIENAVTSLVEGVIEACLRLSRQKPPLPIGRVELELIERYQQPAEDAARLLGRLTELLEPRLRDQVDLLPVDRLATRAGRQPGAPSRGGSGNAWVRVLVGLEPDERTSPTLPDVRRMTFSTLARGAQANLIEHDIDLDKIRAYVDAAVHRTGHDPAMNRTLFELLFPPRAKLDLDRSEYLHLIVDEETAQLPWELLAAAAVGRDVAPLALRAGMLRQLRSTVATRQRSGSPRGLSALFVGDPPTGYPRLPNAREEARALATQFEDRDWDVTRRIYDADDTGDADEWMDVINALHQEDYRLVHIAAHGVFDEDWRRSGVALGRLPEHRLTALDFEAMSDTPDLVFLNCCHLGRIDSLDGVKVDGRALRSPHRVAGTVAQQLLRNGVSAVVVAGWAVDDFAAAAFAAALYDSLLEGYPFGEAVRKARLAAHESDGGRSNTWGAYQCYGDPDFELVTRSVARSAPAKPVSADQLARELQLAAVRASQAFTPQDCDRVAADVNQLRVAGGELLAEGPVLEALGDALGELGQYAQAVDAYQQALRAEGGEARLRTSEQLANLKVRLAVMLAKQADVPADRVDTLFDEARATLDMLDGLAGPNAERSALRGSLEKKRATTVKDDERAKALTSARGAYLAARQISSPDRHGKLDPYHTNLWLQLVALTNEGGILPEEERLWLEALHAQVAAQASAPKDFWDLVALPDTLLTYLVTGVTEPSPDERKKVADAYRAAFALRSTARQRDSALQHLEELKVLAPPERADECGRLLVELQARWSTTP